MFVTLGMGFNVPLHIYFQSKASLKACVFTWKLSWKHKFWKSYQKLWEMDFDFLFRCHLRSDFVLRLRFNSVLLLYGLLFDCKEKNASLRIHHSRNGLWKLFMAIHWTLCTKFFKFIVLSINAVSSPLFTLYFLSWTLLHNSILFKLYWKIQAIFRRWTEI